MTAFDLLADERRAHRAAWSVAPWVVTLFVLGLGVPYMVGGGHVLPLPQAYQAINVDLAFLGGMHTYGAVMTLFGLTLAEGLVQAFHRNGRIRVGQIVTTCRVFAAFTVGPLCGFVASWVITGTTTWPYLLFWSILAACSITAVRTSQNLPPPDGRASGVA